MSFGSRTASCFSIAFSWLSVVFAQQSWAAEKASEVLAIKQNSRSGGLETLYLSDKAMRLVQENAGRITLASAVSIPAGYKCTLSEYDGGLKESGLLDELAPFSGKKVR